MTIIAELLGIPPPASPIRKRGSPISSPSLPSNLIISSSENPIGTEQSLSPSSVRSVHVMAIDTFRTSPVPDKVEHEVYELNRINTLRTPSPQVLYVHNSEKVLLSLNGETFDSPVMILPPLEQEEFEDRDGDKESERKEVKEEEVREKEEEVKEKKKVEEVEKKEERVEAKEEVEEKEVEEVEEKVEEEDEEVLLDVFKRNQTENVESKEEFEKDDTLTSDSDDDQQPPMEYIPSSLTDENTQTAETIVNNSTTLN